MQVSRSGSVRVSCDNEMAERLEAHEEQCSICRACGTHECPSFEALVDFHLLIMTTRHEMETENS